MASAIPNYSQFYGETLPHATQTYGEQTAYYSGAGCPSPQQLPYTMPKIHTAFDSTMPGGGAFDPNVMCQSPLSAYTSPSAAGGYAFGAQPHQAPSYAQQENTYTMPAMGGSAFVQPMQTQYAGPDPSLQTFHQTFGQGFNFYEGGMPGGFSVPQGLSQATGYEDSRKAVRKNGTDAQNPATREQGAKLAPQKKKLFPCC